MEGREKDRERHGALVDARDACVGASRTRARIHAFQCERARRMRAASTVDETERERGGGRRASGTETKRRVRV